MTYCLAMRLDEGLLFMSDTRTDAGVDNISSYRKMHVFRPADDRFPEGNYIRASDDRPFLQIGEAKYGKAWLDLAVDARADLRTAAKIALSSMMSTAVADLSVGPPYDLGTYENGSYQLLHARIDGDLPFLGRLSTTWNEHLLAAVHSLPEVEPGDITVFPPDR